MKYDVLIVGAFGVTHGPRAVGALRTALQQQIDDIGVTVA